MPETTLPPADATLRVAWRGSLTGETAETIAAYLRSRFAGERARFTFVRCEELYGWTPRVRTGQRLKGPIGVDVVVDRPNAFLVAIRWYDSQGLLTCFESNVRDGRDVHETADLHSPYFAFEPGEDRNDQVRIEGRTWQGDHWRIVIAAEDPDELVFA